MLKANKTTTFLVDEALVGIQLEDRISVPTKRTMTDGGQMHVPCAFARTGSQLYSAKQLGLVDRDPKEVITLYRDESEVFNQDSMNSFKSAPLTLGHPVLDGEPIKVTAANAKELQVGMLEGMPVRDEDTLAGTLVITNQEAIDALNGGEQELSAGYVCDIEEVDGKLFQKNIRANHIAIVAKGRAGSSCRISDEADVLISDELVTTKAELAKSVAAKVLVDADLEVQKQLVTDFKLAAETAELALKKTELELVDAKSAASEGVIERCEAIENARLIADMRDLTDKSVAEIKMLVVVDQLPDMKLDGKSEDYISAMFDILVDSSKSETPMSKLQRKVGVTVVDTTVKPVDKVAEARKKSIERNKKIGNK